MKKLSYWILTALAWPLSRLPLGFHHAMGDFLAWLLGDVVKYRRDVVTANLARSFPDRKYDELGDIRRRFYRYFTNVFTEGIWYRSATYAKLRRSGIVSITNVEELNRTWENSGNVFVLAAHCGNWELLGGLFGFSGQTPLSFGELQMHSVYRKLSSYAWDRFMMDSRLAAYEQDRSASEPLLDVDYVLRYAIAHRSEKKIYFFITDQSPYYRNAMTVNDFMHQPTTTMSGAASLARSFGGAVMYLRYRCVGKGRYEMTFVPICEDASGMRPVDIMNRYYELLQEDLEATPWNYLWTHKRWK